jgi:hypothetical protein
MVRPLTLALLVFTAGCGGQSNEELLQNAAEQSDPAAAAVLNNAAENGMDPQQALEQAGQAAATTNADAGPPSGSVQARPNLPESPNRPTAGQPPEKVTAAPSNSVQNATTNAHADHNAH